MMNKIQIFEHEKFGRIRTLTIDGEPWFVGKDVAAILGYSNGNRDIVRHIDEEDRIMLDSKTQYQNGIELGQRGGWIINESGLYSLILGSEKSEAKEFKRWITREVLPAIRKYGVYATTETIEKFVYNPEFMIKVFTELLNEQQKNKKLRSENAVLTEKCSYLAIITKSENAIPITVIAKDYGMSAQEFNGLLHFLGIQYKLKCGTWVLYQEYADCGYTKSRTFVYDEEKNGTSVHTYWTQKGRLFLYETLKGIGVLPKCERSVVS